MKRLSVVLIPAVSLLLLACSLGGEAKPKTTPVSFTVPPQRLGLAPEALPPPLTPVPDCAVTLPELATPPGESRPSQVFEKNGHFVGLWPDGTILFRPGQAGMIEPDGGLSMKIWWWRPVKGGKLEISGHRLDAPAPPLQSSIPDGYDGQYFQATGLAFPTQGCWEVTGRVGDVTITFVTLVLVQP